MWLTNGFAAKSILNELECLLEDVSSAIQTATEHLPPLWDKDFTNGLDLQAMNDEVRFDVPGI